MVRANERRCGFSMRCLQDVTCQFHAISISRILYHIDNAIHVSVSAFYLCLYSLENWAA